MRAKGHILHGRTLADRGFGDGVGDGGRSLLLAVRALTGAIITPTSRCERGATRSLPSRNFLYRSSRAVITRPCMGLPVHRYLQWWK